MATQKQYLDYTGLSQYDAKLKTYIDSAKTKGIKKVIWDSTNEKILFFRDKDATATSTADFEVTVSSADVKALQTRVGMTSTLNTYKDKSNLTDITNILTGADTVEGSVAKALKDAKDYTDTSIQALDTSADVTTASVADGVVTLTAGIAEEDGKIKKGSGSDITLAKVATTGTAADVAVVDADGKFTAENVEAALKEVKVEADDNAADIATLNSDVNTSGSVLKMIQDNAADATYTAATEKAARVTIKDAIKAAQDASKVSVVKNETATEGFIASYHVEQNGAQVGATIDIPKDYLVKSAKLIKYVKDTDTGKYYDAINDPEKAHEIDTLPTGVTEGVEYIDFVVNTVEGSGTESHIYLNVTTLVNTYTGKDANGINVTVDGEKYEISAAIDDASIARGKIDTSFEANIAALEATHAAGATTGTYKTVAEEVTAKVETLDATVSQSGIATETVDGSGLNLSVTEVDGKVTAISGSIESIPEATINGLFTD